MRFAAVVLFCAFFFAVPTAFAKNTSSTVFPPAGCSETEKMVMSWQMGGASTECLTATQVVDLAVPNCKAGQLLVKSASGYNCLTLPSCKSGEALAFDGSKFACAEVESNILNDMPDCPHPFALSYRPSEGFTCQVREFSGQYCKDKGTFITGVNNDGIILCDSAPSGTSPSPAPTSGGITTYEGGCVNKSCSGSGNAVFPVANATGRANSMPAICDGSWWIDTEGDHWDSSCSTGWRWSANCHRPDGFYKSSNNKKYYDNCPDPRGTGLF